MSKPTTKWTPGPWRHVSTAGGWDGVSDDLGTGICHLEFNNPANADLIAAAPDLYEATSRLLRFLEGYLAGWPSTLNEVEVRNIAIAAIAKAGAKPNG